MTIGICSMGYSGYSTACWRALAKMPNVRLKVFTPETNYPYAKEVTDGLDIRIFSNDEFINRKLVADEVVAARPDALVIGGWSSPAFKVLAADGRLKDVRKLMAIDSMWIGSLKQILARFALRSYVKHLDGIIVAGERGRQFARWLGFARNQIFTSTYGYDAAAFAGCLARRQSLLTSKLQIPPPGITPLNPGFQTLNTIPQTLTSKHTTQNAEHSPPWPKKFCFVGRYAPIKGLDAVLKAYMKYREAVGTDAWEFHTFGKGELGEKLQMTSGVVDHGFLQPKDLPEALAQMGAFILPSLHEPWGVALAEAAGAGLPILCSDACASGIDCVRHLYNGYVFPVNDVDRIFKGMMWLHAHSEQCPEMGRRGMSYAGAYTPEVWAERWVEACRGRV